MPELPLELCQMIVDGVDSRSDLLTLILVSMKFKSATERHLYHTITFPSKARLPDLAKEWGVFERIRTCPRVAAYVLDLAIMLNGREPNLPPDARSCLVQVFLSVPNLKTLQIFLSGNIQNTFQVHVPFLLHTFHYVGTDPSESFKRILEPFLEAQTELKDLTIISFDQITLKLTALPKLTTILGDGKLIRAIVPGRPVTRVACYFKEEPSPLDAPHIQSLSISTSANLEWYTASFPNLIYLECVISFDYAELLPYIESLSGLEKLSVSIDDAWVDEQGFAFVDPVFSGCPALRYIEIFDEFQSKIWRRGSQTGVESLWDPEQWKRI